MEMPDAYKQKIAIWLDKKYTSKVELSWQIDSELIAGFMVKDGDTVFDYSVRNKIEQLKKLF
jgi:F0F1-type ATP synthase delta subunit